MPCELTELHACLRTARVGFNGVRMHGKSGSRLRLGRRAGWLLRLQDTEGGDAARFVVLQGMVHVKTVGRNQLDPRVERLAHAILYRRPVQASTSPVGTAAPLNPRVQASSAAPPLATSQPSTGPAGQAPTTGVPGRSAPAISRPPQGASAPAASTSGQRAQSDRPLPRVHLNLKKQGSTGQASSAGSKPANGPANAAPASSFPAATPPAVVGYAAAPGGANAAAYPPARQPGLPAGHQGQPGPSQGPMAQQAGAPSQEAGVQYAGAQGTSYSWQPPLQPQVAQVAPAAPPQAGLQYQAPVLPAAHVPQVAQAAPAQAGLQYQAPVLPAAQQLPTQQGFQLQAAAPLGYQLLQTGTPASQFLAQVQAAQANVQQVLQQLGYGAGALPYLQSGAEAGGLPPQQPAQWPYQAHAPAQPTGVAYGQPTQAPVPAQGAVPLGNPMQAPALNLQGGPLTGHQHNGMGQPYQ